MVSGMTVVQEKSSERRVVANVLRGSVGNLIEWYDWYAYTAFSIYFAAAFFPKGDQTAQLLNTAAVFAVGFLMRPLGGWLLGRYADRHGRRAALTLSVTLMAFGSLIIALTPSYATIGVAAPVLLVLARLLQGLSVGGEYATSATYLSEVASPARRGFYSSFQYVTLTAGQLVALGVQIVLQQFLSKTEMMEWGWRIAFVIGATGAIIVMWLRRGEVDPADRRGVDLAGVHHELLQVRRERVERDRATQGQTHDEQALLGVLQQRPEGALVRVLLLLLEVRRLVHAAARPGRSW